MRACGEKKIEMELDFFLLYLEKQKRGGKYENRIVQFICVRNFRDSVITCKIHLEGKKIKTVVPLA